MYTIKKLVDSSCSETRRQWFIKLVGGWDSRVVWQGSRCSNFGSDETSWLLSRNLKHHWLLRRGAELNLEVLRIFIRSFPPSTSNLGGLSNPLVLVPLGWSLKVHLNYKTQLNINQMCFIFNFKPWMFFESFGFLAFQMETQSPPWIHPQWKSFKNIKIEFYLWHFPGSAWLPLSTCQCGGMGVPTCKRLVIFLSPGLDPDHNQGERQWTPTSTTCPTFM